MSQVKSITTRSSILFVGKIVDAFFMFIFNFLAAKYVGAHGYGTYVYISALIMFISIGIKMGMDHGLTAMIPSFKDENHKKELVTFSIVLLFVLSLLCLVIFGLGSKFVASTLMNNSKLQVPLLVFLPLIFPIAFVQISEGIFRSIGGIKHYFLSKNIIMPVVLVLSFVGFNAFSNVDLYTLILVNYMAWTANVLYLMVVLVRKKALRVPRLENSALFKQLVVISLPLILVGLVEFLMGRTDAYVIGYKLTESDVGVYSIVDKLAYIGNFMFITAGSMMTPVLATFFNQRDFKGLSETYGQINKWILVVNTAVFMGILLLGETLLSIFGAEFSIGVIPLYLLALAQLINAIFGPLTYMFAMTGLQKQEWRIGISMLLVNMALDIIVAEPYGIMGIAYVTVLVYLIGNIIRTLFIKRKFNIQLFSVRGLKTVLVGFISFGITKWVMITANLTGFLVNFIGFGALLMFIYLTLVYFLDLSKQEKVMIKGIIQSKLK